MAAESDVHATEAEEVGWGGEEVVEDEMAELGDLEDAVDC